MKSYLQDTNDILNQDTLTERQLLLVLRRLNNSKVSINDLKWNEDGYKVTPEQTTKGLDWLNDQWKTPRGIERKHNPFGFREQDAIATFENFVTVYLFDAGNGFRPWFVPVYEVNGKDTSFQYYVKAGVPEIVG